MGRHLIESIMGGVVLLVAIMFLVFAWNTADLRTVQGYELSAAFLRVGGLEVGSDVRVSGIKVGTVTSEHLDKKTYDAIVRMNIRPGVKLPADTVAKVASAGLMGGTYVKLEPGSAAETLDPGDRIKHTKDIKSLEDLVGEIIFLATDQGGKSGDGQGGGGLGGGLGQ